ncbi:MAG: GAF domain-containing protein [Solirubrobacterales bacterium]|nr:GAF domain-containing protein [Solirubrobacterales bacterium]
MTEPFEDVGSAEVVRLRRRLDRERRARQEAERISEQATRELYERQQELALMVAVARAANDSADVPDALSRAIGHVCEYMKWPVGHVYLADAAVGLRPTTIWHIDDSECFETFRRVTEATPLATGEGLGGRVLATGRPVWLPDVTVEANFPRARLAADIAVRGGFGFPILVGAEVVGVMEFFTDSVQPADARLLELMAKIGTELGRVIERDRARASEQRLNRELAGRATELARSNTELEQFASIASHDLQEPLRKVRTFTERVLANEAGQLSEQGRDYLGRANASAARMQTLIQDLLTFSRTATRERSFAAVDLGRLTADVLEDLEAAVQRSKATVVVGALPTIDADELQMRQLMQNLLTNALKFRREGRSPEVSIDGIVSDGTAEIRVRDNGIGFDPQYGDRIFRVFERLHGRSRYDGTGIGLALCRKIVERHGGTVRADGVPDVGSTFTVAIPVSQGLPTPR